jgi:hypothetical protein
MRLEEIHESIYLSIFKNQVLSLDQLEPLTNLLVLFRSHQLTLSYPLFLFLFLFLFSIYILTSKSPTSSLYSPNIYHNKPTSFNQEFYFNYHF